MKTKLLTLCMIIRHPEILLGMKKQGFGAGRWNGFGGKLRAGETVEQAARRELLEEVGLTVDEMDKLGVIRCTFDGDGEMKEVHIFAVTKYSGEPAESDEMRPQWFNVAKIPFSEMWKADAFWMPFFLEGKKFEGAFHFDSEHNVVRHIVSEVA